MTQAASSAARRVLVVNADDLGRAPGINEGIFAAHERGIVTSASLMVRWPSALEAGTYAHAHPELSVGLHLDLGEHVRVGADWVPAYVVVPLEDRELVRQQIDRQLEVFEGLVGRPPTHLDSHQHVHRDRRVRPLLANVGRELGIPVRQLQAGIRYWGDFYGRGRNGEPLADAISVDALIGILQDLRPGVTELGCHPGSGTDPDPMYGSERRRELAALCDPRVAETIDVQRIELRSFRDLREVLPGNADGEA